MAYLRELPVRECQVCGARAVVELVNRRNAPCGYFCRSHGRRAHRELERAERFDAATSASTGERRMIVVPERGSRSW